MLGKQRRVNSGARRSRGLLEASRRASRKPSPPDFPDQPDRGLSMQYAGGYAASYPELPAGTLSAGDFPSAAHFTNSYISIGWILQTSPAAAWVISLSAPPRV